MIKLEMQFATFEELAAFAARNAGEVLPVAILKASKPQSVNQKLAAKAEKEKAAAPADEDELTETEADDAEPDAPTFDDAKAALLKVNKHKGKNAALAILKKYNATKVGPELKEKDYAAFIDDCNAAIA